MNPQNTPTAKARQLTVGYHYPDRAPRPPNLPSQPVPYLGLCGCWLKDAGFAIGQRIRIEVNEGGLTIEPAD